MVYHKKCKYKNCKISTSNTVKDVFFIPFPKHKRSSQKCKRWIDNCGLTGVETHEIKRNTYVCSIHFVGGHGPTDKNPDPVPVCPVITADSIFVVNTELPSAKLNDTSCEIINDYIVNIDGSVEVDSNQIEHKSRNTENSLLPECDVFKDPFDKSLDIMQSLVTGMEVNSSILKESSVSSHLSNPTTSFSINLEEAGSSSFNGCKLYIQAAEPYFKSSENKIYQTPPNSKTFVMINRPTSPFKVQDISVGNLNHLYVNFMEYQLYNLEEKLSWSVSRNGGSLYFSKENTKHIGSLEIKVDASFEVQVKVYSKILSEIHQLQCQIPKAISKLTDLLVFLKVVDKFQLCDGNDNPDILSFPKLNSGYINGFINSAFSNECEQLFISQSTLGKCRSCCRFAYNTNKRIKRKTSATAKKSCPINLKRNVFKKKVTALNKQNYRMQLKINKLKAKLSNNEKNLISEMTDSNPFSSKKNFLRLLINEETRLLKNNRRQPQKWHPAIIKWCLYLKRLSSPAYEAMRAVVPLPSSSTLSKYSSQFSVKSGFTKDVIVEMKQKIDLINLEEHQRYFSLIVHEMKIKEDIAFKASTGELVGFSHLNISGKRIKQEESPYGTSCNGDDEENDLPIASHVMSLMVRGLTTNFKHSLVYFPCNDMKAEELVLIMQEAIEILEIHGFKILTVVCDQSVINQEFIKMSTVLDSATNISFKVKNKYASPHDNRDIYYIFDPPHLIKTVRNCFSNSGSHKKSVLLKKNKKHILWKHVVDMYNKDSSDTQLRLCPKLNANHIILGPFNVMTVKFATQVMSNTVANAIDKLVGEEASETVAFIKYFNRFLDMMNTSNLCGGKFNRNCDLDPFLSITDLRFKWLEEEFLGYLIDWKNEADKEDVSESERQKMQLSLQTLEGIFITVHSVIAATKFLLKHGANFVLTTKFNQHPLENHFGKHRRAVECNQNPDFLTVGYNE